MNTTRSEEPDEFDHQVTAWTAGQLKAALANVPDDAPVEIWAASWAGSLDGDDYVVTGADIDHGDGPFVTVIADWRSGRYYRHEHANYRE